MAKYRKCVACMIRHRRDHSLYLVGRRSDTGSFQFPQGGVEPGESEEQAMRREVEEETGVSALIILGGPSPAYCYDFPENLRPTCHPRILEFKGQEQKWFFAEMSSETDPSVAFAEDNVQKIFQNLATDREFSELAWKTELEIMQQVVEFKKPVVTQAFQYFRQLTTVNGV